MLETIFQGMTGMMGQALKAPVAALAAGVEAMANAVREIQRILDRSVAAVLDAPGPSSQPGLPEAYVGLSRDETISQHDNELKENFTMSDQDLSGDDLKLVRWAISFTKRDLELALDSGIEIVDYSTDPCNFAGAKKDDFLQKLRVQHIPWPPKWQREDYPPKQYIQGDEVISLPQDDVDKFMRVFVEVLDRYEKSESHYERDEAKALKGIRTILDERLPRPPQ